jgi:hypothetical protein
MPGMNLARASANWLEAPKSRMTRGIPSVATKQQLSDIAQNVGTLSQTADNTPQAATEAKLRLEVSSHTLRCERRTGEPSPNHPKVGFVQAAHYPLEP